MSDKGHFRRIRSFVRREGRLTAGQERALRDLWPRFGLGPEGTLDFEAIFGRQAPVTLEIGFGDGESLVQMAHAEPGRDFVGIEVHRPGVGRILMRIEELGLENVRVMSRDAVEVLEQQVPDASLDRIQILFPDPWPKKRHHKRRLIQPRFVQLLARKLRHGGQLHLATDWENYAEHMLEVVEAESAFRNRAGKGQASERPAWRPETKFERRGMRKGHGVWDFLFERV